MGRTWGGGHQGRGLTEERDQEGRRFTEEHRGGAPEEMRSKGKGAYITEGSTRGAGGGLLYM
jgi:hypothetical protein